MLNQIRREIEEYKEDITIVDGVEFNQKETIEKIHRILNSKFIHGEVDTDGDRKHFFNIVRNPCGVETKATDFDTKHIRIVTADTGNPKKTWFFERDLKFWMKDKNFGRVLNRIFEDRPKFGTVVIKTINGTPHFVDLRNFMMETSADTLDDSNYIIERHLYTARKFREVGEKLKWENIDEVIEEFNSGDNNHIVVYERYGEVPGEEGYRRIIYADVGKDKKDEITGDMTPHLGVMVKNDKIDKHPYTEFHREKIPGRWLGVGLVEILFEPQIRHNMIANLEAKGDYYAALHVWQSQDEEVNVNLGRDQVDGQIIKSGPINPIDMTERNLSYFRLASDKWMSNRDELAFSFDVIQGERLPAGTPLGSARLAAAAAASHFDQLREDIALDVKEYLYNVIVPYAQKELNGEHFLRLVGNDLDKIQELRAAGKVKKDLLKLLVKTNKFPTQEQYEAMKMAIINQGKRGKEEVIKIVKGFYNNIKYKIDIQITGEQKDSDAHGQALFSALQAMQQMQDLLSNPAKKKFFSKWLESYGIPPEDFIEDKAETISDQLTRGQAPALGGGISAPTAATPSPSAAGREL